MDISSIKPKIDALFNEMIGKLESHGACVQRCKDDYYICIEKCEQRMNDWGCTSECRQILEKCINNCPDGESQIDTKLVKEYLDRIEALFK